MLDVRLLQFDRSLEIISFLMPVHSLQSVALFQHDVEEVFCILGLQAVVLVDEEWFHDVLIESLEVPAASDFVGLLAGPQPAYRTRFSAPDQRH